MSGFPFDGGPVRLKMAHELETELREAHAEIARLKEQLSRERATDKELRKYIADFGKKLIEAGNAMSGS